MKTCCGKPLVIEECVIIGALGGSKILINCPTCSSTLCVPSREPLSPNFMLLHGIAEAIGSVQTFVEIRMALEFVTDTLTLNLDKQFAKCLEARITRKEQGKDTHLKVVA
jgi:hypothetical protein